VVQENSAQISLELEPRDGTIAGRLIDGALEVPFTGWLALTAALEAARARRSVTDIRSRPNS
jgi:hypothetical protein